MHFDRTAYGERIKRLRTGRELTQEQLAEKINVSRTYIVKIENGLQIGPIEIAIELAMFFDHIPVLPAGKAIIVVVGHIQAGVPVVVKGAEGFAISVHIDPVQLCRLPQIDVFFYDFKNSHDTSISAQKRRPARSGASRRLCLFL